jgi:hypothetical protein
MGSRILASAHAVVCADCEANAHDRADGRDGFEDNLFGGTFIMEFS